MTALPLTCPACGEPLEQGRASCASCGQPAAAVPAAAASWALASGPALPAGPPIPPTGQYGPGTSFAASGATDAAALALSPTLGGAPPSGASGALSVGRGRVGALLDDLVLFERLVAGGAGLVAAGLLLPWGPVLVGSPSIGGPLDTLGVMGAGHVVLLLAASGVLLLAVLAHRVPGRLRLGVLPLALAAFAFGLVWPYLVGPLGGGVGVSVVLVGAAVLAVVACLRLLLDRPADVSPERPTETVPPVG